MPKKQDTIEIKGNNTRLKVNGRIVEVEELMHFVETREVVRREAQKESRKLPLVIRRYQFVLKNRELLRDYCERLAKAVKGVVAEKISDDEVDLDVTNSMMRHGGDPISIICPSPEKLVLAPVLKAIKAGLEHYDHLVAQYKTQYEHSQYYINPSEIAKPIMSN